MDRRWFWVGVCALAVCVLAGTAAFLAASSNCPTDVFTGNATNPAGCRFSTEVLGVSVLGVAASAALVILAGLSRRRKPDSSPP